MKPNFRSVFFFQLGFFAIGLLADFVFNGVLKVVWFLVYAPSYLAIAKILTTRFEKTAWAPQTPRAIGIFFLGTVVAHLSLASRHSTLTLPMDLTNDTPMTFSSTKWPQMLIVVSPALRQKFASGRSHSDVPITIDETTNYGCISGYSVKDVAGVDVKNDKDATWTWKTDPRSPAPESAGPGNEDHDLPWCLIKFYRSAN